MVWRRRPRKKVLHMPSEVGSGDAARAGIFLATVMLQLSLMEQRWQMAVLLIRWWLAWLPRKCVRQGNLPAQARDDLEEDHHLDEGAADWSQAESMESQRVRRRTQDFAEHERNQRGGGI